MSHHFFPDVSFSLACLDRQKAAIALLATLLVLGILPARADLILVEDGVSRAPIVIYGEAPPMTRQSADELADYIEKASGARPEVIEGLPQPVPEQAIWVGYQPILDQLFPKVDFDFQHPEEILIAANDDHLVIAGRDRWDPDNSYTIDRRGKRIDGIQTEYGTINAVYTFLQDHLDVRWLFPGELGEDVLEHKTIAFAPFQTRYHPQVRSRSGLFTYSGISRGGYGISQDWTRRQRLMLDSLDVSGGHAFNDWHERFHETHPEYLALQPDGTRGTFPSPKNVKLCQSNPAVWTQWLKDVELKLETMPNETVFNAAPNDGYNAGHCVCENCRAWDHPDGELRTFGWRGLGQQYVAISDRHVTFANQCARLLKEAYPDKDYLVSMLAYGFSRPAPIEAKPDDNVLIVSVANMFWSTDSVDGNSPSGTRHAEQFAGWGEVTKNLMWRPNTGNPAGWQNGLPDVPFARVMDSFRLAADHGYMGIFVDGVWEHWATTGPLYYLMGQAVWNPDLDWRATFEDYLQRYYGPAAGEMRTYWNLMEESRNRKVDDYPGETNGYAEVYDEAFFAKAYGLIDAAQARLADAPAKYRQRLELTWSGLEHVRLCAELRELGPALVETQGKDPEVRQRALDLWDAIKANCEKYDYGVQWMPIRPGSRMARGGHYHPDHLDVVKVKPKRRQKTAAGKTATPAVDLQSASESGWELVFSDDFERDTLGNAWIPRTGTWTIEDGALRGSGILVSAEGFPGGDAVGFQRMEFTASTDVKPMAALGPQAKDAVRVCDISAMLHANPDQDKRLFQSGYFFQFGGQWNTKNGIRKNGAPLAADEAPDTLITVDKRHQIVIQNDQGKVSLFVDGESVLHSTEADSILGSGFDHVGWYFETAAKVYDVKIYVKRLASGLDTDASETQ